MYAEGRGVVKDDAEAVRWFRLAADQGAANSQYYLGAMYGLGRGVLKDSVIAHMWFNIAGANGSEQARTQVETWSKTRWPATEINVAQLNWRGHVWPRTTRTASRREQEKNADHSQPCLSAENQ